METFNWTEEAEKQWDEMAGSWNSRSREMWETGSRKEIIPFVNQYLPQGAAVCDLGCGDGSGTEKLARAGYIVTGMDVSEEMLGKAVENLRDCGARFKKGDLLKTGFPESSFDAVLAINSVEWTSSPFAALKEMERIIKPGGFACIGILGPTAAPRKNSYQRLYGKEITCNTIMPWELEQLAEENSWKKAGEYGVYKKAAMQLSLGSLPVVLQQALSFMWVFMFQSGKREE
ncbi:class I SAM-dependent methyltransferase [Bacillus sp. REN3]|uniref:class I SAM-dependent methyltransferase n=1 Tax=Bacillus sp. REN3 TaxID=2802440 RepID=UPI001AEF2AD2|nr:class I SAM-dependent methyltransferase [Bacillus sp. REN3]